MYLVSDLLLSVTPGPAVMLVSTQGLKYGARASYFGSIGISSGNIIYFILSAFGLGALVLAAGNLFAFIKIAGAIYLVWTGAVMFFNSFRNKPNTMAGVELRQNRSESFVQGFITQAANPKAIIFFVAFLPQFIDAGKNIPLQFLIMALTTVISETSILMCYGWLASRGKKVTQQSRRFTQWQDRIAGSVLIGLGVNLFFMKGSRLP